jgi:hypothetical protein
VLETSTCQHCGEFAVWLKEKMIFPLSSMAPKAARDMPTDAKQDFDEARSVFALSAKSAAALLRLALQKLLKQLGEKGKNIDDDIASLVKKGLPVEIQKSLDIVRVIGNEAVHPGQIDLKDNPDTAAALFALLNIIVDRMITQPKRIADLYSSLPKGKLDAIAKRDGTP